jgi:hypothetical protein
MPGEVRSGDAWVVLPDRSELLLAAIDGLGHGPDAADAADEAVAIIREHGADSLEAVFGLCHRRLAGTRGAAITLTRLDPEAGTITWRGVGNVEGVLVRAGPLGTQPVARTMLGGGVVGMRMPRLRPQTNELKAGDLVLLATDGVHTSFPEHLRTGESLRHITDDIMARCGRDSDDAMVMAVRYRGKRS